MGDKPKRRWFQFSLRTLLIAVTLVAILLGSKFHTIHKREKMLAEIESKGGRYGAMAWWALSLGSRHIRIIELPPDVFDTEQRLTINGLFPEAEIIRLPEVSN